MTPPQAGSFAGQVRGLTGAFDRLSSRRILLFGGKGGVGKTTVASLAALHLSRSRPTILFSTDPASNLADVFGAGTGAGGPHAGELRIESLDAEALWGAFLAEHLESFVELGDRGTYLDRDEIRSLFQLAIPGIDELMGWSEIGAIAEANPEAQIVVDTAPTGHTVRLLSSSRHFDHLATALEQMQSKHHALVSQLTRRRSADALDGFLSDFRERFERRTAMLSDPAISAFVPVVLAEPWVVAQTARLAAELSSLSIATPFGILNQSVHDCDCAACAERRRREEDAARALPFDLVRAPRACVPLGTGPNLERYLAGEDDRSAGRDGRRGEVRAATKLAVDPQVRLLFFAGKGGVGKTSAASSVALQLAEGGRRTVLISVDPAHSVADAFRDGSPLPDLRVETIDTRLKWRRLRERLGDEIERAVRGLTSPNVSISHDSAVLRELIEIAPPGADEIFAVMRLADLLGDAETDVTVVDTAPTGHFLRLLDLPRTAGAWAREMMRLLLRYKELVPPGSLAEELLEASRALRGIDEALRSPRAAAVVVMRAEPLVAAETARLVASLQERGVRIAGTIVNSLTPESGCGCDTSRRISELEIAACVSRSALFVDRRPTPPHDPDSLRRLIPLE
jgi:arsenite-transporting ATPase